MTVIDVDAHIWEPLDWLERANPQLHGEFGDQTTAELLTEVLFGEVIASMPPETQQQFLADGLPLFSRVRDTLGAGDSDGRKLSLAEMQERFQESPFGAMLRPPESSDPDLRVEYLDQQGIDLQVVNPTMALGQVLRARRLRPDLVQPLLSTYNSWIADFCSGHSDRLLPSAFVDLTDPQWAAEELSRMRTQGARTFLFPLSPPDGKPFSHPDFDLVWSSAVDLGMLPTLHVAAGSVHLDPAWFNTGRSEGASIAAFRTTTLHVPLVPQLVIGDFIVNGVFHRHPELVLLCSEFGFSWVPGFAERFGEGDEGAAQFARLLPWPWERRALDYLRDNVRFSPLRGQDPAPAIDLLGPDSVVFASDWPHPEGSANAVAEFRSAMAAFGDATVERFMGASIAHVLR